MPLVVTTAQIKRAAVHIKREAVPEMLGIVTSAHHTGAVDVEHIHRAAVLPTHTVVNAIIQTATAIYRDGASNGAVATIGITELKRTGINRCATGIGAGVCQIGGA